MYNCIIVSRFFYDFSNISNRCWNFRWKNIRKISNRKREREKNKFRYIWKNEIDVYFTKKCKFFLFKIGNDVWRRTMKLEYCPRQKECSISLEFYWWNNLWENFVSKMNDRKKKKKNYFQNEYVRIPSIDSIRRIECIESDRIPNKNIRELKINLAATLNNFFLIFKKSKNCFKKLQRTLSTRIDLFFNLFSTARHRREIFRKRRTDKRRRNKAWNRWRPRCVLSNTCR